MAKSPKILCKTIQIHAGLDLIGSKMSLSHKTTELEVTAIGVRVFSKKTKRIVIIPWGNIKGAELLPGSELDDAT